MWLLAVYVLGALVSAVAFAIGLDVAYTDPDERGTLGLFALVLGLIWPFSVPLVLLAWLLALAGHLLARIATALSRARP